MSLGEVPRRLARLGMTAFLSNVGSDRN